jgi:hypothetical protein
VIYAYKHWGWFKTAVDAAWKGIKAATSAVASWFMTWVWPTLKRAFDFLRAAITVMVNVWIAEFKLAKLYCDGRSQLGA